MLSQDDFEQMIESWVDTHHNPQSVTPHLKLTAQSLWDVIVWSIAKTDSDPLDVHGDKYLQMNVKIQSFNNGASWDLDDEFVEPDLSIDEETHTTDFPPCKEHSQSSIHGLIDIILHPTYQVPCPYIRLFDSSGQPIAGSIYEALMKKKKIHESGRCTEMKIDKNVSFPDHCYEDFGDVENPDAHSLESFEVIYEEHPYKQTPCLCVHVCGILPRIKLLESSGHPVGPTSPARGNSTEDTCNDNLRLQVTSATSHNNLDKYFLHWLVLMGHTIGLDITIDLYNDVFMANSL